MSLRLKIKLAKEKWITTGAAADYCGVSRATILRWIKSGKLKAYTTPGGHHRMRTEDFREFLANMSLPLK
jgi:excisionase family DNA binding protein